MSIRGDDPPQYCFHKSHIKNREALWEAFHLCRTSNTEKAVIKIRSNYRGETIMFVEGIKCTRIKLNPHKIVYHSNIFFDTFKRTTNNLINYFFDNRNKDKEIITKIIYSYETLIMTFVTKERNAHKPYLGYCWDLDCHDLEGKKKKRLLMIAMYDPNSLFYKENFPLDTFKEIYQWVCRLYNSPLTNKSLDYLLF